MSGSSKVETKEARPAKHTGWKLLSVEIGGWAPIGPQNVIVDLSERRTVLIGRNGAGKSAVINGIFLALKDSYWGPRKGPRTFKATFQDHAKKRIIYEQKWEPLPVDPERESESSNSPKVTQSWTTSCWYEGNEGRTIWNFKDGRGTVGETEVAVPPEGNIFSTVFTDKEFYTSLETNNDLRMAHEALGLFLLFCGKSKRIHAGIPHPKEPESSSRERTGTFFLYKNKKETSLANLDDPEWNVLGEMPKRFAQLFKAIFAWSQSAVDAEKEKFAELKSLGKKVGAFHELSSSTVDLPDEEQLGQIKVDGANAGVAPDGSLRLIEILASMIQLGPWSIMLVEEPETGIHPAALIGLLHVLDSYAEDRQFLLSSHSPVIIGQVNPDELRIIYRKEGQTFVRALSSSEMARAKAYLSEDGTLDEFLNSGGLDDS